MERTIQTITHERDTARNDLNDALKRLNDQDESERTIAGLQYQLGGTRNQLNRAKMEIKELEQRLNKRQSD